MSSQQIEISEAIAAVEDALAHLNAAHGQLKSAGNWGLFDMFGGGGFVTLIKHSKMAGAQRELEASQAAIARLARELQDVEGVTALGPDVGEFLTFADFLFDNPFVDMYVQSKIADARDRVEQAIAECEGVRERLLSLQRPDRSGNGGLPAQTDIQA